MGGGRADGSWSHSSSSGQHACDHPAGFEPTTPGSSLVTRPRSTPGARPAPGPRREGSDAGLAFGGPGVSTMAAMALALWTVLSAASIPLWFPAGSPARQPLLARTALLLTIVAIVTASTGIVALLAGLASPLVGRWAWLGYTVAVFAAFACGGPLTSCLLSLADASSRPGTPRVQRTILRGGSWIGALERLLGRYCGHRGDQGSGPLPRPEGRPRIGRGRALHHRYLRKPGLGRGVRRGRLAPSLSKCPGLRSNLHSAR